MIETITVAIISSGALSAFIAGIFSMILNRKGRLTKIEDTLNAIDDRLKTSEKDALRTQLLIMMSDYPEEQQEIMTLAQRYFGVLKGDWYASSLFNKWILEQGITEPIWFTPKQ